MPKDSKRLRDSDKRSKKKKKRKSSKKKNKKRYDVIEDTPGVQTKKESYGEEPWFCACDCKRCLNGRCGAGWLPVLGLLIAGGLVTVLWLGGVLGMTFETSGNATLYEEICDSCTTEPTGSPTAEPTMAPTVPTEEPTGVPSVEPTKAPTGDPSTDPTGAPSVDPTAAPTSDPTSDPTSERRLYDFTGEIATPNIVILVTENLAMSDFSAFHTPKMDEFFEEGFTFTDFHSQPSKGSIMTGQWSHKLGINKPLKPCEEGHLDFGIPTWAEHLKSKGYTNYYYGKWNMGADSWRATPLGRGWDSFYGCLNRADGLEHGDGGSWEKRSAACPPDAEPEKIFETSSDSQCLVKCYGSAFATLEDSTCRCYTNADCSQGSESSYVYTRLSQSNVVVDWWRDKKPVHPGVGKTGDEMIFEEILERLRKLNSDDKWTITVSFSSHGKGFVPQNELTKSCEQFFDEQNKQFDFQRGLSCQWMWDIDEKVGSIIDELKKTGVWENTIVILTNFNPDDENTIFSIGGGALPAELLSSTNEDLHSIVDITPTIMAIGGFSDEKLEVSGLDGINMIDINQATAMVRESIEGSVKELNVGENPHAAPEKCGSEQSYVTFAGFNYNAPWLDDNVAMSK